MTAKRYTELDPRRELEQAVAADLRLALEKRGVAVTHHGTPASPAPASAPGDITLEWKSGRKKYCLLVEVAQRRDESEYTSIVSHLDAVIDRDPSKEYHVLYSGRATSVRMARLVRYENQRREDNELPGRIIFIRLDDLQELVEHWRTFPKNQYPVDSLIEACERWGDFTDDINAFRVMQECLFPKWEDKAEEIRKDIEKSILVRQERLRADIVKLENKLRERGITNQRAHKILIYLFFLALYEDKRGAENRFTLEGFVNYKRTIPPIHRRQTSEYYNHTAHYLITHHIMADPEIVNSGMMSEYRPIDLDDDFITANVLPIFEGYTFATPGMDVIGAVFEALARRAEKDNRIGQFFTPETAVEATCLLVKPRPTDLVADPACGTARFLIYAMSEMLKLAHSVPRMRKEEVEESIKKSQLLGVDVDPWVATIAKMNMYIHGDGKSNIVPSNGLALSTVEAFSDRPGTLNQTLDVALTNPPLGDIDFREVAMTLARDGLLGDVRDAEDYPKRVGELATEWSKKYLSVVPHVCNESVQEEKYLKKIEEWRVKENNAEREGGVKTAARAKYHREQTEAKLREVQRKIGSGQLTYTPSGRVAKGGVLFLSAIKDYLKDVRDPKEPEEWKGGAVGIIVDEAVLNARDYERARQFIYRYFFVKAVISLPRDAFEWVAKTNAKTSILFLTKKPDPDVLQREPVFYARAESIGYTAAGKPSRNDLTQINADFDSWEALVKTYYSPEEFFGGKQYAKKVAVLDGYEQRFWAYPVGATETGERLDFAYRRMRDEISRMKSKIALSELVEEVIRTPREHPMYEFATAMRVGRVRRKGEEYTSYQPSDLREIKEGDIIFSGIDIIHGAIGVVGSDCDGCVVSKEYYVLRIKDDKKDAVLPEFLSTLLRSPRMQIIIEGLVTGTSNRTRVQDIQSFLELPIPALPPVKAQEQYAEQVKQAFALQDEAEATLRSARDGITQKFW